MQATPTRSALLLNYRQSAELLSVSERTILALVQRGELRSVKIGRCVRIPREEVENFISRGGDRR